MYIVRNYIITVVLSIDTITIWFILPPASPSIEKLSSIYMTDNIKGIDKKIKTKAF